VAAPSLRGGESLGVFDDAFSFTNCQSRFSNFVTILQNKRNKNSKLATTILIQFPSLL
ncbi:hypothetical protein GIB67_041746, partial [Kingdonia uniflora]